MCAQPAPKPLACIILAAGKGTRMMSDHPKILHKIAGRSMIGHVIAACESLSPEKIIVVVGPDMEAVTAAVAPHKTVIQTHQKGTADAVMAARSALGEFGGDVLILIGDAPLITSDTLVELRRAATATGLAVLGMDVDDPHGYGRLITNDEWQVTAIIEDRDCNSEQQFITLCNAGNFCVAGDKLFGWLDKIGTDNAQNEYYLTDIVKIAAQNGAACGLFVAPSEEAVGINDRAQLAEAEWLMQRRLRLAAMRGGVTLIDPETVYLSHDTTFGRDVIIEPNVFFGPKVTIANHVVIHAFSHLEDTTAADNVQIGPFARLRGRVVLDEGAQIGNFVEVKKSHFHRKAKAKHLAYIGDATVGEKTNISAGVITVNYDGFDKHHTTIGKNVMVGCDSTLVAPVTIGDGAYIAAGSAITKNVAADSLAVARNRAIIREGWAVAYRAKKGREKSGGDKAEKAEDQG